MKIVLAVPALIVLQDAFEVMLLPRRVRRELRFMRVYFRWTWAAWSATAVRVRSPTRREHFLGLYGPLSMLLLFAIWAAALIVTFGTLEWALEPTGVRQGGGSPLSEQIYMTGVSFFTLGYGDVVPHSAAARGLSVVIAGTGIGFIAVVIGYLPVLYQFFSRREAHVIQLDGRAGSPPTAATMLCRHAEGGGLDQLNVLLREWEVWASELLESHLSYPMLAYYRSQHHNQSWLSALACVMDCCALVLVGVRELPPLQARMTFTMARQVLVEMAQSFAVAPSRYDGGDRLGPETYARLEAVFAEAEVGWRGDADAQATLAALRATYEPLLDGLARYLLLNVPNWLPDDDAADHWEGGHRGLIARRLIKELGDRSGRVASALGAEEDERLWRRLRSRLREE
jgi:hypothetical protein